MKLHGLQVVSGLRKCSEFAAVTGGKQKHLFGNRLEIAHLVRRIDQTYEDRTTISKKRDELLDLIQKFDLEATRLLGEDACAAVSGFVEEQHDDFDENGDPVAGVPRPLDMSADTRPELLAIALPSMLPYNSPHRADLGGLIKSEFELRKGHANDCLASIRQIIGHQSFQFKNLLRTAQNKVHRTRARTSVNNVYRDLTLKAQIYRRTRVGLESLRLEPELLESTYRILDKADLKVSAAIGDPNQRGLSQTGLSWIWTTMPGNLSMDTYITECTCFPEPLLRHLLISGPSS